MALGLALAGGLRGPACGEEVRVVVSAKAPSVERTAAEDLAKYLGRIYPQERFAVGKQLPPSGRAILVGTVKGEPRLRELLAEKPTEPESYVVTTVRDGQLALVAGADPRGVVYGVYALLEKLGCGFYLSYDALPPPRREAFSLDGWHLADRPLVADRLVFNWHNFLSGCSTWNLPEWKSWIVQSQKQGYNAVMVHAYGNNPMVSFTFNGKTKPIGYLSTTSHGRDWSTMHVNDVRRIYGGEVFDGPVFAAEAAMVTGDGRAEAARRLMQQVFAAAADRSMGVFFANDVDTISANPQELILTLPETARFATVQKKKTIWLANPDTPEGYGYYKAQVAALMVGYPQITTLVVWFRGGGTPWLDAKLSEFPAAWQREYQAAIAAKPEAAKYWHPHSMFAIAKIVRAFDKALKELGHDRVALATGTWNFGFMPACDLFTPSGVKLIGLDYDVLQDKSHLSMPEKRQILAQVGAHRPVLPVIWAHHDDGNYVGRPYTPFAQFHTKLTEAKACGFGIIHWTTRPLDLFFASHVKQVWQATKDQPLRATCETMAERSFGPAAKKVMGEYLQRWVTDAPKFARETSNHFIDRPLEDIEKVVDGCRQRLKRIVSIDSSSLTPEGRDRLNYFKGLEQFIADIHQVQGAFQDAEARWKRGDVKGARTALAPCRPEAIIEQFAKFSRLGGMTRGEQGLVVTMNTRWLPHYVRLRQALGLEAVRCCFGPTSHDPLAQAPGSFTFHFTSDHRLWQTLGTKETGADVFVAPSVGGNEICRAGIEIAKPFTFAVRPILRDAKLLPPGNYRLRILAADPVSTAVGQRVFDIEWLVSDDSQKWRKPTPRETSAGEGGAERIDLFARGGQGKCVELVYPVALTSNGAVAICLTPVVGKAILCGVVLEPLQTLGEKR